MFGEQEALGSRIRQVKGILECREVGALMQSQSDEGAAGQTTVELLRSGESCYWKGRAVCKA